MLFQRFLLIVAVLGTWLSCSEGKSSSDKVQMLELSPSKHMGELRRVLYGGEPFLSFCAEKNAAAAQQLNGFIDSVQRELGQLMEKVSGTIHLVKVPCGEMFPSGKTNLQKTLKLKREHSTLPVLFWTVNGMPGKQLKAKTFTSPVKGDVKDSKEGQRVQLDAPKLARSVVRNMKAQLQSLTSNDKLMKDCLASKYQLCAVLFKEGGVDRLASSKMSKLLGVANAHRFTKFFVVDTRKHALTNLEGLAPKDESLVLFKRKDFKYSGPPGLSGPVDPEMEKKEQEAKKQKEELRAPSPIKGRDIGDKIGIASGMKKIAAAKTAKERISLFRKERVATIDQFKKKDSLAFLFPSTLNGDQGFIIDWTAAQDLILALAAFGQQPTPAELAKLQEESLRRAKGSKSSSGKAIEGHYVAYYDENLGNHEPLVKFLKGNVKSHAKAFVPFSKKPVLSKLQTRTANPQAATKSKPRPRSGQSKQSGTASASSQNDQIEREQKRRQEMEEEAKQSGAFALLNEEDEEEGDIVEYVVEEEEISLDDEEEDLDEEEDDSCDDLD